MFDWTRAWIRLRREHAAMRSGRSIDLFYDDETYVFARQHGDETVIVAFNRQNQAEAGNDSGRIDWIERWVTLKSVDWARDEQPSQSTVRQRSNLPAQTAVAFKALLVTRDFFQESSGILLHPTSLPGPFGIGDLGPEAYKFVDFLVAAGQSLVASVATWTNRLRRFALCVLLGVCRQHTAHQSGTVGH